MGHLFVTGASGFIGKRLVTELATRERALKCLSRSSGRGDGWIEGELLDPTTYASALEGADAVVHLAALTGKGTDADHHRATVEGTEALLGAAIAAKVRRFVFVSTIAVRYPEKKAYPYARAKETAEKRVKESGLDYTILRPTLVFGEGSPIQGSLAGLANKPFTPLFGNGRAQVQPILCEDVARAIADALEDDTTIGAEIDLGGPDRMSFDELMQKMREAAGKSPGPLVHLPVGITSAALSLVEPLLLPVLPVTAGQLYAFRYDSTAEPTPFLEARLGSFGGIGRMLANG